MDFDFGEFQSDEEEETFDNLLRSSKQTNVKKITRVAKEATLYLVDCRQAKDLLFKKQDEIITPWQEIIDAIIEFVRSRLLSNRLDLFGLTLFGTRNLQNAEKVPHVWDYLEMGWFDVNRVQLLKKLRSREWEEFEEEFGGSLGKGESETVALLPLRRKMETSFLKFSSVVRYTGQMFAKLAPMSSYRRRLVLITGIDEPTSDESDIMAAKHTLLDLIENEISFVLLPLKELDTEKFYEPMLRANFDLNVVKQMGVQALSNTNEFQASTRTKMMSHLIEEARKEEKRATITSRFIFQIAPGVSIGAVACNVVQPKRPPLPVMLRASDNQPLKVQSTWICGSTGKVLSKLQLRQYLPLPGDGKVMFTPDELFAIKRLQPMGGIKSSNDENDEETATSQMILLSFINFQDFKKELSVTFTITFVHSTEDKITGSSQLFNAMLINMIEEQLIAIVSWRRTVNSSARLYAGIPQLDDTSAQTPGGLYLIPLPYKDDVRDTREFPMPQIDHSKGNEIVSQLIKSLKLPSKRTPDILLPSNPALDKYYATLEALALGEQEPTIVDETLGDPRIYLSNEVDDLGEQITSIFGINEGKKGAKRAASSKNDQGSPKATKSKKTSGSFSIDQIKSAWEGEQLSTFKVPELKDMLKVLGLPVRIEETLLHFLGEWQ